MTRLLLRLRLLLHPSLQAALAAALLVALPAYAAGSLEAVTLQLKWKHQFQFAGYYMAVEKGYYRDAGFDVQIAEATGAEDSITTVVSGKAAFGVAASELALRRAQGEPVVALATVLQHSALALAVRGGTALTVHDLDGQRIMVSQHDQELFAYLQREGLSGSRVKQVPQSFDIRDLIDGKVQGFSVYTTDQVWALRQAGLAYTLLSPRAAGIDFYGDTLFTSAQRARDAHDGVAAFRDASVRGWQYAMAHPAETVDLILARYSQRLPREHLLFEAEEMARLMQPQLIEIGHMNPGRWQHIAEVYAEIGMLPRSFSLDGFVFSDARGTPQHGLPWLLGAAALAAMACAVAVLAWQNRRLQQGLRAATAAGTAHTPGQKTRPTRDALTGLYSRTYLEDTLPRDLQRAAQQGQTLSLAVLQIERFAQVVRDDGPAAGDALVQALAALVEQDLEAGEYACRLDGPRLAWVLPGVARADAAARLRDLGEAFAGQSTFADLIDVRGTIGHGLAVFPRDGQEATALLNRALSSPTMPPASS